MRAANGATCDEWAKTTLERTVFDGAEGKMNLGRRPFIKVCLAILVATALAIPVVVLTDVLVARADADSGNVLKIGFLQKVDSLNPNVGLVDASYVFYSLVYDCPQIIDEDMNIIGNLCPNSYVDEDYTPYGSAWIMELTQNAYWHDGEPLTADDVVFTLNLNAEHYTTMWAFQPYAYFMDYAERIDDYTVRVHYADRVTGDPIPAAYARILGIHILPEHMLGDMLATDVSFNWVGVFDDSNPPLVGTGPFMATEDIYADFIQGDMLNLVKNPRYHWDADRGKEIQFDGIQMQFYSDATAMAMALENEELDIAQFPPNEYNILRNKVEDGRLEDVVAYNGPKCTQHFSFVGFNLNNAGPNPSRLDRTIRLALNMATDLDYINENYYLGLGEPATTMIPPINEEWHYELTEDELHGYDWQAADNLLEESGYRYTDDSPDVRICTVDSYAVEMGLVSEGTPLVYDMAIRQEYPEEKNIAQYLESEWAKIGVKIEYRVMTEAAMSAYAYAYSYDTLIWYWSADVDPMYMLFCQSKISWNGWNENMWTNPEYEDNFRKQAQEFDDDLRREYVHNCQRIHYEDCVYVMLNYVEQTYGWRTDSFEGWGDWEAHPGRSMDNFWTGNPLFFDLVPLDREEAEVPWLSIVAGIGAMTAAVVAIILLKKRNRRKGKVRDEAPGPVGE